MQKVFWCGALLAVVAATAVFALADYAERHPDSSVGCCARAACQVATALDPVALTHRVGQAALHTAVQSPETTAIPGDACDSAADEPKPVAPLEIIDLSRLSNAEMGAEEEASAEPAEPVKAEEGTEAETGEAVTVPPTPIENDATADEDPVPTIMPPATDEITIAPRIIINAEEEMRQTGVWNTEEQIGMPATEDLIQEDLEQTHGSQDEQSAEATAGSLQPEMLPMPHEEAAEEDEPADEVPQGAEKLSDEEVRKIIAEYLKDNSGEGEGSAANTPEPTDEYKIELMPANQAAVEDTPENNQPPAAPEEGSSEESEMRPGTPPDLREDPHHDQQYPGCPYMGGCPGNMHCPPPAPADLDKPKVKKKKKDAQPEAVEDTGIRRMKYEEFATPAAVHPVTPEHQDWVPTTPKIDTMEFRRTEDAKPGEFDPRPY